MRVLRIKLWLLIVVLSPVLSQAESGVFALEESIAWKKEQSERENLCQKIKAQPNCPRFLSLLNETTGLSVQSCIAEKKAAHCESFFAKFPKYKPHEATCSSYDVCKKALSKTTAEGCRAYGIEVKDGFLEALNKQGQCFHNWKCLLQEYWSSVQLGLMPGQVLGKQIVSGALQYKRRLENVGCLDAEAQAQLACYTMVQGTAVLGGAVGAGESAVMARMAQLEADLALADAGAYGIVPKISKQALLRELEAAPSKSLARIELGSGTEGRVYAVAEKDASGNVTFRTEKEFFDFDGRPNPIKLKLNVKSLQQAQEAEARGALDGFKVIKSYPSKNPGSATLDLEFHQGETVERILRDPVALRSGVAARVSAQYTAALKRAAASLKKAGYHVDLQLRSNVRESSLYVYEKPVVSNMTEMMKNPLRFQFIPVNVLVDADTGDLILIDPY